MFYLEAGALLEAIFAAVAPRFTLFFTASQFHVTCHC